MGVAESKSGMTRLLPKQLSNKLRFIDNYVNAVNAATGSTFDPNSNVTHKNVGTLMAELNKDINIQVKRGLVYRFLESEFTSDIAQSYIDQLEEHLIYCHDETAAVLPYCAAVSIDPYIQDGLKMFGGDTKAPKHLSSYNGGLINLVFALTSQFAGAVAIVEYFLYFNYFAIKDYGEDYLDTHKSIIEQELQQFIYAINQPAAARGMQSAFTNLSIFDEPYFNTLFEYTTYPDGTKPKWEQISRLQQFFLRWFNKERTKALLTFPVVTCTLLTKEGEVVDKEYYEFVSKEISEGNAFFIYMSDSVDSLSSCCRLRNSITDQLNDFQYSLGAGGIMTGSINVLTLNVNRFVQKVYKDYFNSNSSFNYKKNDTKLSKIIDIICDSLSKQIRLMHKFQVGFRKLFEHLQKCKMLPAYDAHYIELDKQYCTIGLNGVLEAAEFLNIDTTNNPSYKMFLSRIFQTISYENIKAKTTYGIKFNTELVPAESLGVKFAKWDKKDGYYTQRECYNSYLYPVEDYSLSLIDKFKLHGSEIMQYLDGGSALHLNLENYPSYEAAKKVLNIAAKSGCPYFCFNVKVTICNECGYIDKRTLPICLKCHSENVDYATRVIGYLKRISSFSAERQLEARERFYHTQRRLDKAM